MSEALYRFLFPHRALAADIAYLLAASAWETSDAVVASRNLSERARAAFDRNWLEWVRQREARGIRPLIALRSLRPRGPR